MGVNPLIPMGDQDRISPSNINITSSRQVAGIKKVYQLVDYKLTQSKFSKLSSQELYGRL